MNQLPEHLMLLVTNLAKTQKEKFHFYNYLDSIQCFLSFKHADEKET
jgi:hypothetical protein